MHHLRIHIPQFTKYFSIGAASLSGFIPYAVYTYRAKEYYWNIYAVLECSVIFLS